jgi:SAM-dependent methyltransferase
MKPGLNMPRLLGELEQEVDDFSRVTSPNDAFATKDPEAYFASAQWALNRIKLALLAARRDRIETILDLPSGYGRVLRMLRAAFPDARVTACDIDKDAVDFCAGELGAIPVYSTPTPADIPLDGTFDLIWCGSLLTHVDEAAWSGFLRLFADHLTPGNLLVFTTLGPFVADQQIHSPNTYGLTAEQVEAIVEDYRRTGFGYRDYKWDKFYRDRSLPENYGIALASPSWVCSRLEEIGKFDLLTYTAGGWGRRWGPYRRPLATTPQDVIGCIRRA